MNATRRCHVTVTVAGGCCCRQPAAAGAIGPASCAAQRAAQLRAALRISAGQRSWRPTALRSGPELLTAQRTKRWELRLVLVHSAVDIAASRNFPLNSPTHNLLQPAQAHPALDLPMLRSAHVTAHGRRFVFKHHQPAAHGLFFPLSLLRAVLLHVIKRNQGGYCLLTSTQQPRQEGPYHQVFLGLEVKKNGRGRLKSAATTS